MIASLLPELKQVKQIEILDDFLPTDTFERLRSFMCSTYIPWYYIDYIVDKKGSDYQFVHRFLSSTSKSPFYKYIKPIIDKISPHELMRVKANLRPKSIKPIQTPFHTDYDIPDDPRHQFKTAIYYINTNNGYTIFKHNKQQVQSKANRLLVFNGHLHHAGVSNTDNNKNRIVININYYPAYIYKP